MKMDSINGVLGILISIVKLGFVIFLITQIQSAARRAREDAGKPHLPDLCNSVHVHGTMDGHRKVFGGIRLHD